MTRTSSGRETKAATDPSKCRSCQAEILWVKFERSGKRMPVDAVADNRPASKGGGTFVLFLRGGPTGDLLAEKYDMNRHEATRNRYTSHFATCPDAAEHRRGS